ncbi:uncharacterized protein LOC127848739 isoform X2 [Dreissena polymorpha]|uniref:uncharacterized protein LOC127848739 isoform X2 n=1 Tax=Dreissena polymorpha TaxID=45954 RepID=UPI002264059B|nr:uncharacterized protein LOC127848739 isoform X2 [Dreissena polymorpha]XP_052237310.1 uncharacterized protein LOC127848739 isoform X2 [Dreissena polymorpha]XP_052237311.1 uncharacterized protein LOC127848739 isoform X2 [Dreissena polymorpha]
MTVDFRLPPIHTPVILTDPYKGSHVLRWSKSRGNPGDISVRSQHPVSREASFTMSLDDDDLCSTSTPYRLPRLSPGGADSPSPDLDRTQEDLRSPVHDKVWSRHGYEKIIRIPELGPQVRMLIPPSKLQASHVQAPSKTPRFKNAAITPSVRSLAWNADRPEDVHLHLCDVSRISRGPEDDLIPRFSRLEPTPTPISRSQSPAKSVKSIHWILGHNRYHTFDKKGRGHIQGPYSREFNVTCMAPQNWLKMKWGRSKTMIH